MTEPAPELPDVVGWWTMAEADAAWPREASIVDDADRVRYLAAAFEQCVLKARVEVPVLVDGVPAVDEGGRPVTRWVRWTEGDPVPERLRQAQLLQASAIAAFERTGGGDYIGPEGTQVRVYPMGWQVETLLVPDEALGVVG